MPLIWVQSIDVQEREESSRLRESEWIRLGCKACVGG